MFKNETHNHPTEIEPFGGAATCIGGAIRDPLSGRSYVYQAMRISGAGDITTPIAETRAGKLPQQVISKTAAHGYSSYGNQIGLATTYVREYFHPGFVAKRMELVQLSVRLLRKMLSVKNQKLVMWLSCSVVRLDVMVSVVRQVLLKFKRLNLLKQLVLRFKRECHRRT